MEQQRFSPDFSQALHGISSTKVYAEGAILFRRGDNVEGVYVVEFGETRVLLPRQASSPLLYTASSGMILGLSETISGEPHSVTAEAREHSKVMFIPREKFMALLYENNGLLTEILRLLSEELHSLYNKARNSTTRPGRIPKRSLDSPVG